MEEKYCGNCLYARPLSTDAKFINCTYEGPRYPDLYACDKWASACIDEAHGEKVFDVAQLKPSSKHYIFCNIDNKTGEGHLVVKLDFKFKTKTMLPDDIYRMTLQELLDMEDKRMSDILTKEELKVFAEHPFYHDKIELLEKLKTRTNELLAMYVPLHSINCHSLRHYIHLIPGGRPECPNLVIEVDSYVLNNTNSKAITYSITAAFTDLIIESTLFDAYFDRDMMEKLKELSGAIVAFSNRESDEIY